MLVADPNSRVRLIAAGFLLGAGQDDPTSIGVLMEALSDPAIRVRKSALELIETLGERATEFLEALKRRGDLEEDEDLRISIAQLIEHLGTSGAMSAELPQESEPVS